MALLKFPVHRENSRTLEDRQKAKEFGVLGEQMATRYLEDNGYVILDRNYRKGHQEVDIIALDHDELAIVEVKTRTSDTFFSPDKAVDHQKRLNLIRVANNYIRKHHRTEQARFDIIVIITNDNGNEIKHIKNAYNVMAF